jgi:hypothetical protein
MHPCHTRHGLMRTVELHVVCLRGVCASSCVTNGARNSFNGRFLYCRYLGDKEGWMRTRGVTGAMAMVKETLEAATRSLDTLRCVLRHNDQDRFMSEGAAHACSRAAANSLYVSLRAPLALTCNTCTTR